MKLKMIPTGDILRDSFFRFSAGAGDALKRSIAASGVETPLRGIEGEDGIRLMAGFRRFEAALEIGLASVPLVSLSFERPLHEHYRDVLLSQSTLAPFTLLEKSRVLAVLERLGVPSEEQAVRFAPILSLPSNADMLQSVRRLLLLPGSVQSFVEIHGLTLRQCDVFFLMPSESQEAVVALGDELGIKGLELADMARILHGISLREERPVYLLIRDPAFMEILKDQETTRSQKVNKLKSLLDARHNPYMHRCRRTLDSMKKDLGAASVFLKWDPGLEKPGIELHAKLTSLKDVAALSGCFSPEKISVWKSILEIL